MTRCYCSSDRGREADEKFNAWGGMDRQCRTCGRWMIFSGGLVTKEQRIKIALQSIKGQVL